MPSGLLLQDVVHRLVQALHRSGRLPPHQHIHDQRSQDLARGGALWQLDQKRGAPVEPLRRLLKPPADVPAEPTGRCTPSLLRCAPAHQSVSSLLTAFQSWLQYLFDITKEADEVLISLQQKDLKILRRVGQGENLTIGFSVFKVTTIQLQSRVSSVCLVAAPPLRDFNHNEMKDVKT